MCEFPELVLIHYIPLNLMKSILINKLYIQGEKSIVSILRINFFSFFNSNEN